MNRESSISKFKLPTERLSKKSRAIAILALTLTVIVAGVLVTLPYNRAAHAAGATITLPPSWNYSNSVDAPPIKATGTGFGASSSVNVYWNCKSSCTGNPITTATVKSGAFTALFLPPLAPSNTYYVTAVGYSGQNPSGDVATGSFLLLPQLYAFPRGAGPGSPVAVHGNAFQANETVNVYWNYTKTNNGTLISSPKADANGVFVTSNTNFPSSATPGSYYIGAIGKTSGIKLRFQVLVYKPLLALAPLTGSASSTVTVSALGLAGLESVNVYWNNDSTAITTGTANAFGHLPPVTFTVPSGTAPGSYPVKVVGQTSKLSISNTFTLVSPSSSLDITSGPVGNNVTATGEGYAPNETVNILWNYTGTGTGTNVGTAKAGISGTFTASFAIPAAANGSYNIAAVGTTSKSVSQANYMISSTLATSPATAAPGTQVTAIGTGYQANESVKLYWDSTSGTPLASATADGNGNINQALTFPASATSGNHKIIGVGKSSAKSFTAPVSVETEWSSFGFNPANTRENPSENTISASNVGKLIKKWTVPISNPALGEESSPVYANGTVYVPSADGTLKAFNATTGALQWASNTKTGFLSYASALVDPAKNLVFFGTCMDLPGPFYALDTKTGAVKWSVILAGSVYNFPTLAFHNIYIGISKDGGIPTPTNDTALLALDEVSGHISWQDSTNGGVWGAVGVDSKTTIGKNANTVFTGIGDPDNAVEAVDALTGAIKWHTPVGSTGNTDVGSSITVANGLVYADAKDGNEYAFNESSGVIAWNAKLGTPTGNLSSQAVSSNGTLYVGALNRVFFALDAKAGTQKWKYGSPLFIFSSPAVANGVVYFADTDTNFYAVDASTGTVLWNAPTGNKSFTSPIMVNGWLYGTSTDGMLYAFSL